MARKKLDAKTTTLRELQSLAACYQNNIDFGEDVLHQLEYQLKELQEGRLEPWLIQSIASTQKLVDTRKALLEGMQAAIKAVA